MNTKIFAVFVSLASVQLAAHSDDDPLLNKFKVSALELNSEETQAWELTGDYWLGKDLDKFWLKFEAGSEHDESALEKFELQALYSKAISAYWDLQFGLLHDFKQEESQTWGVVGFQGLAPYWFEVDSALLVGADGELGARLEFEYELMLTQNWRLVPELELELYGQNNPDTQQGSGLSSATFELSLVYDISRKFSLYTKYENSRYYGKSADFKASHGAPVSESELKLGISFWF